MKRIFSIRAEQRVTQIWLLLLRICVGAFMLTHGIPKLTRLINGEFSFADPIGFGQLPSLIFAVFAEFLCSLLIIIGLRTRLATIPLIITMLTAAFIAHGSDPFAKKEMALLYLLLFITLFIFGGGRHSFDRMIDKKRIRR